jgi:hypothetical protein
MFSLVVATFFAASTSWAAGHVPQGSNVPVSSGLSIIYVPESGRLSATAPQGSMLTALEIQSAAGNFTGTSENLDGIFDFSSPHKLFKLRTGGFSSLELGPILPTGLTPEAMLTDLTVDGASLGGGFNVGTGIFLVHPLIAVPEPGAASLVVLGAGWTLVGRRRK